MGKEGEGRGQCRGNTEEEKGKDRLDNGWTKVVTVTCFALYWFKGDYF